MTPSGRFGIHYCTLHRRADPDRQILNCGEGRSSPPQGPSGRSRRSSADLLKISWVVSKPFMASSPVGLFQNRIMIATPSGPSQMIKLHMQRNVVRRPPRVVLKPRTMAPSGGLGTDHDSRPRQALPEYIQCFHSPLLVLEFLFDLQ